jgi:hypothetical protein
MTMLLSQRQAHNSHSITVSVDGASYSATCPKGTVAFRVDIDRSFGPLRFFTGPFSAGRPVNTTWSKHAELLEEYLGAVEDAMRLRFSRTVLDKQAEPALDAAFTFDRRAPLDQRVSRVLFAAGFAHRLATYHEVEAMRFRMREAAANA